jgi:hypothetical protein
LIANAELTAVGELCDKFGVIEAWMWRRDRGYGAGSWQGTTSLLGWTAGGR